MHSVSGYKQRHAAKISYDSASSSHYPISPSATSRNIQRSISPKPAPKTLTFSGLHRSISPGTSTTPTSSSSAFSRSSLQQVSQKSLNLSTLKQLQQSTFGFQRSTASPLSRSKSPNNIQRNHPPANPFSQKPLIPSSDEQYTRTYHIVNPNNFLSTKSSSAKNIFLPVSSSSSRSPLARTSLSQPYPQTMIQGNKTTNISHSQRNNSSKQLNSIAICQQKTPEKTNNTPKQSFPSSTKYRSSTPKSPFNQFKQSYYQPQQHKTDSRRSLSPSSNSSKPFESSKVSQQKLSSAKQLQCPPPSQSTRKAQFCTRVSPQKYEISTHKELRPFSKSSVEVGAIFIDTGSDTQEEIVSPRFDFSQENQSHSKAQKLPASTQEQSAEPLDSSSPRTAVHFSNEITQQNRSSCCSSSSSNRSGFQKIQASMLFKETGEQLQKLRNNQDRQVNNAQSSRNYEQISELTREINMEKQIAMNEMEYLLKQLRKYQTLLSISKAQQLKEQETQGILETKTVIESQKQTIRELIEKVDREQESFDRLAKTISQQQTDSVMV